MKFIANKEELLKNLTVADSIINIKSPLAILLNLYIEVFPDGNMIILSFNGENGVRVESNAIVEEPGKAILLSKKLLEIIRKIPNDRVVFRSNPENENEIIIHPEVEENPKFTIFSMPVDSYPVFNEFNWSNYIRMSQETLLEQISCTDYTVSTDPSKPAFTGIYIEESIEGYLTFVASDGKRLAYITRPYEEKIGQVKLSVIIPEKIFKTIKNILKTGDALFSIQNQAFFKIGNVYIFSNLVEGKFPSYKDVIPKERNNVVRVNSEIFLNAIDIVSVMSDPDTGIIIFNIDNNIMKIYTSHNILGEAKEIINIEYKGSPITISVNHKSLTDFLRTVLGKDIEFVINSQVSPVLLKSINDDNYIYICMPIKIHD